MDKSIKTKIEILNGSCCACDTLQEIRFGDADPPTEEQLEKYYVLGLSIICNLKPMQQDRSLSEFIIFAENRAIVADIKEYEKDQEIVEFMAEANIGEYKPVQNGFMIRTK